ncbi:hypothetical protein [Streptomyces sp. ME19-01-6]|uniref:hypothetical protein n=1 Tax=Streptomyces sp. ME19-01-6 TaxID=3028686 RepID=UPI0029AB5D24|nr:hypothetical protein [Streptomyces sp. ME19-01-6]MDX3225256.1 hypothetical protein [Streptomyces sp. ME19-01-6]
MLKKKWRSRAVAGLALGAAVVAIPLTAGSASADSASPRWRYYASYTSEVRCQTAGNTLAQQGKITAFQCNARIVNGARHAQLFVR